MPGKAARERARARREDRDNQRAARFRRENGVGAAMREDRQRAGKGATKRAARQGARNLTRASEPGCTVGKARYNDLMPRPREVSRDRRPSKGALREELDAGR